MNKFIVGITGGIGSGKSTIANLFKEKNITVVDADQCSRVVVEPGRKALNDIAIRFGSDILLEDGHLNRSKLRELIFTSPEQKKWLEQLLHPLILQEIIEQLQTANSPYAMLESPLLIEAGQNRLCNSVLVVDAPEEIQIQRAMQRDGNSRELIESIMNSHASRQQRHKAADNIIDNSASDVALVKTQVNDLHEKYLDLVQQFTLQKNSQLTHPSEH